MATITDLTSQKRNADRINVFLDGRFAFGLPVEVAAELRVGQQLSADEVEALRREDETDKAKSTALRLISLRPRSVYEVQTHLQRKSFDDEIINQVIEKMMALDLLDDAAFAAYWVEQRETFRPRSRFALSQELHQKGVSRAQIDAALEQVDEMAAARRAAEKKAASWAGLPEDEFRARLARFLQRRGFSYEVIVETLDATWQAFAQED
jgi:regulatory protein